jgi:hypothetical protein
MLRLKISNLALLLIFLVKKNESLDIECRFFRGDWEIAGVGIIYYCETWKIWNLDEPKIQFINGTHESGKTNEDVQGMTFYNGQENMTEFPQDIHKFFPNILVISFWTTKIKEISSSDLQHFPNLVSSDLQSLLCLQTYFNTTFNWIV